MARHRRAALFRTVTVGTAGAVMLGAVFGLTAAAPEAEPAVEQQASTVAGAPHALRPERAVSSRGRARAIPGPVEVVLPRAQPPQASPSPSPTPTRTTEQAAAPPPAPAPAPPPADAPEDCDSYSGNRLIACAMLSEFGFGVGQMPALDNLWTKESGWNHQAQNPSSGAYGIPQALPGDKMASVGDDWQTNPATQIRWGLGYIRDRYGDPNGAWAHFQANNWY